MSRGPGRWGAAIVGPVLVMCLCFPALAFDRRTDPSPRNAKPSLGGVPTASNAVPGKFRFDTSDSPFISGSDNQGWFSNDVTSPPSNSNYFVGREGDGIFRNFFTFDLSPLKTRVFRASLKLRRYKDDGRPRETWVLHDVTTGARELNTLSGARRIRAAKAIYKDLGSGLRYGTYRVSTVGKDGAQIRTFVLNRNAIAAINDARGHFFSVGGKLTTASDGGDLFSTSEKFGVQRLVLKGCSITGTDHSDTLVGTPRADIICAKSGADIVVGRGGNDLIIAGDGNDVIATGAGRDVVRAGDGSDVVLGREGNDRLDGRGGRDILRGGTGSDRLVGSAGVDVLQGGSRSDHLQGKTGNDQLWGGAGPDTLDGGLGTDACRGGQANDTVRRCETSSSDIGERRVARALSQLQQIRKELR